jgi:ABC-type branched-subunit amino acid transport system substrate-binding protein
MRAVIFALCTVLLPFVESALCAEPFRVGIIIPLTGDLAGYGAAVRNGFELARKEFPEKLSNIEWVYEDSRYDGKVSISALTSLRTRHKIHLYYTWGVSPNEALLPVLESSRLATIAETTLKRSTVGKKYVIRAARTGEMLAEALIGELKKRKLLRAGIIAVEIPYYTDIITALEQQGRQAGVEIAVVDSYTGTQTDFRSSISSARRAKFDAVGVFLLPDQIISFYRQAGELNYKTATFGSDIPDSQKLIDVCPDNVSGLFFPSIGVTEDFRKSYVAAFKDDSFIGSGAQSYDMALLVGDLFNGGGSNTLSSEQIIERLSQSAPRDGATGHFRFTESADDGKAFRMPVVMKEVVNKQIVDLK